MEGGDAPKTMAPLDAVAAALDATAPFFEKRRRYARQRRAVIAAHAELRERELIKLASLAVAVAASLHKRGVPVPTAALAAEAGIAVFRNVLKAGSMTKNNARRRHTSKERSRN